MWMNFGLALSAALFGGMGFYLTLIAKFYRLKFGHGPRPGWMGAGLAATVAGMLFRIDSPAFLPAWLPAALMSAGGFAFSFLAYALYRSMMHARPRGEA